MHQTSSRLLRMTDDDRPFTRDFKDLFSTLIVSLLPLSPHRVRLTRVEHTFLSEDAINNLGSLKFSQSNRMPDPKDPSRIVTTTTTTTFSMAKDMARSICQRFLDARFIESADGKLQQIYTMKGAVWQLTSKGVCVLDRFCSRNGIQQRQIVDLIQQGSSHLCILERDPATDKLVMDRGTMEVVFRRLCGVNGLNIKSSVSSADSDSLSDYRDGLAGVKMASERKVGGKVYKDTFTGKSCSDWLMDCCTTVDRRETYEMASLFVEYELMESIFPDRGYMATSPSAAIFQPTKSAIYQLTAKGKEILSGTGRGRTSESEGLGTSGRAGVARDSNTQRLDKILNDAALRLLFRENLRDTHCEENLSFYLDVEEFVRSCRGAIKSAQKNPNSTSMDGIKEIMAQAYGIYNAFLAPGSPCELNIDHQLRNNLATRMTKAVGQDVAMIDTLHEVTGLFEDAQNAVFKLMASDSVPKFLRNAKYENTLKNYDFDAIVIGGGASRIVERSQSRSNRR
ncbi:regulator of G-protein signaling [Xylariaceae sp. FL1272]|nr:regulator of G-protein signaling [Xylariaceae sp. FL1272]